MNSHHHQHFLNAEPNSPTINAYGTKYSANIMIQLKITWTPLKYTKPLTTFPNPQTVEKAIKAKLYQTIFFEFDIKPS